GRFWNHGVRWFPSPARLPHGRSPTLELRGSTAMAEPESYCDYRMTVRIEIPNQPGQFARLATALAEEGANLGAIDLVEVRRNKMIRDITFDAQSEAHAEKVVQRLRSLPDVRVRSASDRIFLLHLGGKIHTRSKVPVR